MFGVSNIVVSSNMSCNNTNVARCTIEIDLLDGC